MFGVKLSRTAEHLFNLAKKKYGKVARFSRYNAKIKCTYDSSIKIFEFMHKLNAKYHLNLTISLHQGDVIFLR